MQDNKFYVFVYKNKSIAKKYIPYLEREYLKAYQVLPKYKIKSLTKEVYMDIINMSDGDIFIIGIFSKLVKKSI